MSEALIELVDVSKQFDGGDVLVDINLTINRHEFVTLLGPSGCGKTTTLRIIAGFETPTSGHVYFEGKDIVNVPPYKRKVNTVFQKYALFPHMNVFDNIAFGLVVKKTPKDVIKRKVGEMLKLVNLEGFEKRSTASLSGGQQQRVAIARALINEPEVLLLDEPLGALDLKLRKEMQLELKKIQRSLGITFVYVTHDQEEALTMSDTVVVMNNGVVLQTGTPVDIYNEPKNAFVANFIGESNIVSGIMRRDYEVEIFGQTFECVDKGFETNEEVDVVIRPEDIKIIDPVDAKITGIVKSAVFKGVHYEMMIECGNFDFMVHSTLMEPAGKRVGIYIAPFDFHIMKKAAAAS